MRRPRVTAAALRRLAIAAAVALTALVTACSTLRLTYGQAPTLGYWWLDGYADFSSQQSPRVKAALTQWFGWHRRSQLPDYAALLDRARHEVLSDTTPAQVCGWWAAVLQRRDAALAQLAPAIAEIGPQLTPEQLEHMQRKFTRNNEKWRDAHLQGDLRRRERAALERAIEQAERLYGGLSQEQIEYLASQVRATPGDPQQGLALRERQQQDILEMLRQLRQPGLGAAQAQAIVKAWLARLSDPPDPAARHYRESLRAHWCAASAALHNQTQAEQRAHAARALRGWKEDLAGFTELASAP